MFGEILDPSSFPRLEQDVRPKLGSAGHASAEVKQNSRMSSSALPSLSSSSQPPTWSWKIQNFVTPQTYAAKSVTEPKGQSSTTPSFSSQASNVANSIISSQKHAAVQAIEAKQKKRKRRRLDRAEAGIRDEIAEQYVVV